MLLHFSFQELHSKPRMKRRRMHFLFSLWLLQARLIFHQGYCSIQISHSNVHRLIEYITLTFKAFSSLTRKTPGDDESDYIPQNTELIQPRTFILQVGFHDTICDFFYIHGLHPTQTVWCYSPNFRKPILKVSVFTNWRCSNKDIDNLKVCFYLQMYTLYVSYN